MWDLRKLKAPVHVFTGLPTTHSETGCCFSPDESLILTGVSAQRDGTGGALLFFDVNKYATACMPLTCRPPACLFLNQAASKLGSNGVLVFDGMPVHILTLSGPQSLCRTHLLYIAMTCGFGRQAATLFLSCHHKNGSQINNSKVHDCCTVIHKTSHDDSRNNR